MTRLLLKLLAACCVLDCVSAEKQVGTLLLYDTLVPRPPGITDPMAVAEWTAGGVAFGNAVWAYGALLMLDPKASTHVQWPESQKANAWHQARRASNSHLYPSSDVLYAAMGPFILDSSNEPWIFKLAENLRGGATSPSGTTPVLTSTPWGLRTVHTGYAYRPPACCTYPGGTGQLAARGRTHGTVRIHRTRTGL